MNNIPINIPPSHKQPDCICSEINNHLEKERIQLREDYDLMFNRKTSVNVFQIIELEFLKWEPNDKKDLSLPSKLTFPVLYNHSVSNNVYVFPQNQGLVKILINSDDYQKKDLQNYLRNNQVQIVVGQRYKGTIPLYKILSSNGSITSVSVHQTKGKREVLKGHCFLKLDKQLNEEKPQPQEKPKIPEEMKEVQYIWIYLQSVHFLKRQYWHRANIFLNVKSNQQKLKTKTVWNSNEPIFNQIITLLNDSILVEIYNKQQQDQLVGICQIQKCNGKMVYNEEVPIISLKKQVIGYLGLSKGCGTIVQANQFIRTHQREKIQQPKHTKQREKSIEKSIQKSIEQQKAQEEENQKSEEEKEQSKQESGRGQPQNPNNQEGRRIVRNEQNVKNMDILQVHNVLFTEWLRSKGQYYLQKTFPSHWVSVTEFQEEVGKGYSNFISAYINTQQNKIDINLLTESFDAFKIYYFPLVEERNNLLKLTLQQIEEEGKTINQIERECEHMKLQTQWKQLKKALGNKHLAQRLRYFYYNKNVGEVCDSLRKYQVFQTSERDLIQTDVLQNNIKKEICQVLQLHEVPSNLYSIIKANRIELSKWEEFNLIKGQPQVKGMMKSPTFGVLGTDRVPEQNRQIDHNPSIQFMSQEPSRNLQFSKEESSLHQPEFGKTISPINKYVSVKFSNIEGEIERICIDGKQYEFIDFHQELTFSPQISYEGHLVMDGEMIEFEGNHKEWISLVDEEGLYRGCLIFQ